MLSNIKEQIKENIKASTNDFTRVFHGRGKVYEGLEFLTIDKSQDTLFVVFFKECESSLEDDIVEFLKSLYEEELCKCVVLQKRYLREDFTKILLGELASDTYTYENGLKYKINYLSNQNIGFFADMQNGRRYIKEISEDKNVLNLFSYTCSFSVSAYSGGAKQIVNVDMSKSSLNTGKQNHILNNQDTRKVKFLPFNILKSWSKIRKFAPYDIIIIDPPSFQKGSFAATKDYIKLIKKLEELASEECIVLSCLNDPKLNSEFILDIFKENASTFKFEKRVPNLKEFEAINQEDSLKTLVFKNY